MVLSFAKDDFGLAKPETDCTDGGRMPVPTLAEKEEFDVVLDEADVLR